MSIKKYTDWRSWWDGLRTNLMKCIGTTGTAWLLTNGLAATGIPGTANVAIDWKQAVGFFGVHLAKEIFDYMKENQPKVIVENDDSENSASAKASPPPPKQ